jgi:hypothetical protein
MSGASNLGYSRIAPLSNINTNYVNANSSNNPSFFGSTETSSYNGLAGAKSNIDAADGKVPGICLFKGGSRNLKRTRNLKRKIKNISKKYKKMKRGSKKIRSLKRKLKTKYSKVRKTKRTRKQKGGYSQYQNNMPMSASYSTGGNLSPSMSALANPVPFKPLSNCVDNYNRFTNMGFSSKGH